MQQMLGRDAYLDGLLAHWNVGMDLNRLSKSAAGAITLECKRAPRPPGFASVETLDDARPDIQLRRQE